MTQDPVERVAEAREFRVVWRWREQWGHATYPERRKAYKTREGADRLLAKLQSNGGRYEKIDDPNDYSRDGDFVVTSLVLDYARLETRPVGAWESVDADEAGYVTLPDGSQFPAGRGHSVEVTARLPVGAYVASALMAANYPGDSGEDVDGFLAALRSRGYEVRAIEAAHPEGLRADGVLYRVWDRVAALRLTGEWTARKRQVLDIIAEERAALSATPTPESTHD